MLVPSAPARLASLCLAATALSRLGVDGPPLAAASLVISFWVEAAVVRAACARAGVRAATRIVRPSSHGSDLQAAASLRSSCELHVESVGVMTPSQPKKPQEETGPGDLATADGFSSLDREIEMLQWRALSTDI